MSKFNKGDHSPIVPGGGLEGYETLTRQTIDRHVGKSVEYLKARFDEKSNLQYVSTFYDRVTAEKVISEAINKNTMKIKLWLENPTRAFCEIDYKWDNSVGIILERGSGVIEDITTFRVVLLKDSSNNLGYKIKTSYPKNMNNKYSELKYLFVLFSSRLGFRLQK